MNLREVFASLADQSFYGLLASFAEPTAAPGGGSASALAAALAAALVERCADASHPQFTEARSRATELRT
jgi:formiminotetrahydrofolate cyclodeaminase